MIRPSVDSPRPTPTLDTPVLTPLPTLVDVVIVGGGSVGATVAVALANTALRVLVLEATTPEQGLRNQRAYALTLLTGDIFQGLGVWADILPCSTAFETIRLTDGRYPQQVIFRPEDLPSSGSLRSHLGYVAEHRVILRSLLQRLERAENVIWCAQAEVQGVIRQEQGATVMVRTPDGQVSQVRTPLVVAADGSNSPLRRSSGLKTWGWKYWQSCVGFTIRGEYPHQQVAHERFWPSGPLALLPLPDQRYQVVWTAPHREAAALAELEEAVFLERLRERCDHLGQLTLETPRRVFPVKLMQGRSYVDDRLALVGDAAHCCHPVGGQGMNLGIRDAAALAQVILEAQAQGEDWGQVRVLNRYDRWRRWENWLILGFTDLLDRCFSNQILPLVWIRRLGLHGLMRVPRLRRFALQLMTGQLGRKPALALKSLTKF